MKTLTHLKATIPLIAAAIVLVCFGLSPRAAALLPPPAPDGDYPGYNTAEGQNALFSLSVGTWNTAVGAYALYNDTTGTGNTAVGINALRHNVTGGFNTAVGLDALFSNVGGPNMGNGSYNSSLGSYALFSNISGYENSAFGFGALQSSANDAYNTAIGFDALNFNNGGQSNTAIGGGALSRNTTGNENTAIGSGAALSNTTGNNNTATGVNALFDNDTGNDNTANGHNALVTSHGNHNTAIGSAALNNNATGSNNVALGFQALQHNTTGSNNIAVGLNAGLNLTMGNGNIDIGNQGIAGEFATTRVGAVQTRTFISGIRGVTTGNADAIPVLIDSFGQLGTMSSSHRFKKEIKPMDKASEAILALKPVTFHYKSDDTNTPQFGLIAEEVAEVNPDLVVRDEKGEIYTVRYDAVNAMLLNEFIKEHRKNEEQEATIARLEKQLETVTATLQKVSAQFELNKPAPQTVLNNQ